MKYFYDRKTDSLYLSFADRSEYQDSLEAAPGVVLDFDHGGRLIGIDLERASRIIEVTDLELHEEPSGSDAETARVDGSRLKKEREELGISQLELARRLSVSANTVARWERGELKIEHPGMLQLALTSLRSSKQRVTTVKSTQSNTTHSSVGRAREIGRNAVTGHFKEVGTSAHKSDPRDSHARSVKKK